MLGPTTIAVGDRVLVVRSAYQRRLVAALVLAGGTATSADRLAHALWGDVLPADPGAALKNHVSRLRRALGSAGELVETVSGGYRLSLEAADVDAVAFEETVGGARDDGDARQRSERIAAGLALWRGSAYEDLDTDAARAEATRLVEVRLAAEEAAGAALLQAGELPDAIAALERLCATEPLREQGRLTLAEALARSGRRADALRTLDDLRRRLVTELGLDPSPAVGALERAILAPPAEAAPVPRPAASVLGRDLDADAVEGLVGSHRLVTLVGPGGVGKTTLALVVAHRVSGRYGQGCAYVDLTGVAERADVPAAFARALGVERQVGGDWTDRLAETLTGRHLLLVVDNAEQVINETASVVDSIVRRTGSVAALVTSREALALPGERLWPVEPLAVSDDPAGPAIALFCDRAVAVRPEWQATDEDLPVIVDICRRLDGLPLAIELAAAQLRFRSCREIAERLDRPLELLDRGSRADARHRSLRAMVDSSYNLLDASERAVFDRLGIFTGAFLAETAQQVCADLVPDPSEFDRALVGVVERSLARADTQAHGTRYTLLETLRHYACEHLSLADGLDQARDRHAAAIVGLVERAEAELWGPDERQWVAVLDDLRADMIAAHRWLVRRGDDELSLRLAVASYSYAWPRGRSEILALPGAAVTAVGSRRPPAVHRPDLLAPALGVAADVALVAGDVETATRLARRGLDIAAECEPAAAFCHGVAGDLALFAGDTDTAAAHYRAAADGFLAADRPALSAWILAASALADAYGQQRGRARGVAERALAQAEGTRCSSARAFTLYVLAEVAMDDDPAAARSQLASAVHAAERVGANWVAGLARLSLATSSARAGDIRLALEQYEVLIELWRRAGNWTQQWNTLRTLVPVLVDAGEAREAARLRAAIDANAETHSWGLDAERLADANASARTALGPADYERAMEEGRRLSPIDALTAAEAAITTAIGGLAQWGRGPSHDR